MEVTADDVHDSKVLPSREGVEVPQLRPTWTLRFIGCSALLEARGLEPIVKPRRNSHMDEDHHVRRGEEVGLYRKLGHRGWVKLKHYGRRWMAETAFSTFKRLFGEYCLAKTLPNIVKELTLKAFLYNMIINL